MEGLSWVTVWRWGTSQEGSCQESWDRMDSGHGKSQVPSGYIWCTGMITRDSGEGQVLGLVGHV